MMKKSIFVTNIFNMKLYAKVNYHYIEIINNKNETIAIVYEYRQYDFDNNYDAFYDLPEKVKIKLFKLLSIYAITPIKER